MVVPQIHSKMKQFQTATASGLNCLWKTAIIVKISKQFSYTFLLFLLALFHHTYIIILVLFFFFNKAKNSSVIWIAHTPHPLTGGTHTALGKCMIIHLQKAPQSLHLNAISRRDKVHITVTVSLFSCLPFKPLTQLLMCLLVFKSLLLLSQEILNRDEIEVFLDSKQIFARTQLFHVAGFHADFWLFIYLISHTLSFALKFKFRQIQKFKGKFIWKCQHPLYHCSQAI